MGGKLSTSGRRPHRSYGVQISDGQHRDASSSHVMEERVVSLEGTLQVQREEIRAMAAAISQLQAEVTHLRQQSAPSDPLANAIEVADDVDLAGLTPAEQVEQCRSALVRALDVAVATNVPRPGAQTQLRQRAKQYARAMVVELESGGAALPAPGSYTDPAALFDALSKHTADGLVPVRLVRLSWLLARAQQARLASGNDAARAALALPRRQQLEIDCPDAFFSVDELRALPPSAAGTLPLGALSYCAAAARPNPSPAALMMHPPACASGCSCHFASRCGAHFR